jgi:hypothetical protein
MRLKRPSASCVVLWYAALLAVALQLDGHHGKVEPGVSKPLSSESCPGVEMSKVPSTAVAVVVAS